MSKLKRFTCSIIWWN